MEAYYKLLYDLLDASNGDIENGPPDENLLISALADPRELIDALNPFPEFLAIAKDPYWTAEEACAYAVGLRPGVIYDFVMRANRSSHWIADTWLLLDRYATRATEIGDLPTAIRPDVFWQWIQQFSLRLHDDFIAIFDDEVARENPTNSIEPDDIAPTSGAAVEAQMLGTRERALGNKERRNLHRLIFTMAVKHYKWAPDERGKTALAEQLEAEMEEVVGQAGKLSARTIGDILKHARDVVNGND